MKIAPSILTADFTRLRRELKTIKTADFLHLDIMDGHFVPNISFGPSLSKQISQITKLPLDIHLMVSEPLKWIDDFSFEKTKYITIHVESDQPHEAIKAIRKNLIGVGVSIKPKTPVSAIADMLDQVDLVLVMTVEPGFGGQAFIPESLDKVKELVRIRKEKDLKFDIEVDGGINHNTIHFCKDAGVDIVVVGSFLFNQIDRK
ncbi:MAG: ribulose-phosphate 3-epimerase [Acholeplasmataceae bacterium]|nr:ribulose-phosphate 3-epimerase [Acholeplasmataceae bacterium]